LSRTADITLDGSVETEACPFNIAPTSSAIVALALGDAMAICTMKLKGITVEDFSRQHPLGQIGRNITLQVKDIMHSGEYLPLVNINSDFREAIIEISNKGLGCVCVVNDENILKGIVTDGDIRRVLQNQNEISGLKTADVMTVSPVTIDENSYLGDALTLMESRDSQIAVLPVADSAGICKGVVRIHDIVRSGI
jgi:arabinose-5-phosphate isomerase